MAKSILIFGESKKVLEITKDLSFKVFKTTKVRLPENNIYYDENKLIITNSNTFLSLPKEVYQCNSWRIMNDANGFVAVSLKQNKEQRNPLLTKIINTLNNEW